MTLVKHKNLDFFSSDSTHVTLKAFFKIMEAWHLSTDQQIKILGVPRSTFFKWKDQKEGRLSKDTLERISYIFGIYKALQILIPNSEAAHAWVKNPNHVILFGSKPPLHRMLSGHVADLYVVRQYLDAARGGWS